MTWQFYVRQSALSPTLWQTQQGSPPYRAWTCRECTPAVATGQRLVTSRGTGARMSWRLLLRWRAGNTGRAGLLRSAKSHLNMNTRRYLIYLAAFVLTLGVASVAVWTGVRYYMHRVDAGLSQRSRTKK